MEVRIISLIIVLLALWMILSDKGKNIINSIASNLGG